VAALQATVGGQVRAAAWAGICLALGALGCASQPEYVTDEQAGSDHALFSIERSTQANNQQSAKAGALAGFVRVPVTVDTDTAMGLMGLDLRLPDMGQCAVRDTQRSPDTPLSPIDRVQLLEVGDVSVQAGEISTTLAPRAFPTVTDLISGVVYTTRDLSAEPLPAGEAYTVRTAGSDTIEPMALDADAPGELGSVTIGGLPLAEVKTLSPDHPIDLTWRVGDPADVVYVELSAPNSACVVCSFNDSDGAATVPAEAFSGSGQGRISLHRVRTEEFQGAGLERSELRFDFELATDVTYE